ncbi:hypothetical protein K8I28_11080, partial [bacterium]|nr:hypothetical protein [bacterium]
MKHRFTVLYALVLLVICPVLTFSQDDWQIAVRLQQNDRIDTLSHFGVHPEALDGYDQYDIPSPPIPPNGNYLRAAFNHPEWGIHGLSRFNDDIKAGLELNQEKAWAFAVMSSSDGEVTVSVGIPINLIREVYDGFLEYDGEQIELFSGESLVFEYTGQDTVHVTLERIGITDTIPL